MADAKERLANSMVQNQGTPGPQPQRVEEYAGQWTANGDPLHDAMIDPNNPFNNPNSGNAAETGSKYNDWLYGSNSAAANNLQGTISPLANLQGRTDYENKQFQAGLGDMKKQSANLLTKQADQTANLAVRNVRKSDNARGLLYSNIRESGEASAKGRVSSLLAKQIAESNMDYDKSAEARQNSAAQAKLGAAEAALERQSELDNIRQANNTSRAQQMQQLASIGGYAAGRYAGGGTSSTVPTESYNMNGRYITNQVS